MSDTVRGALGGLLADIIGATSGLESYGIVGMADAPAPVQESGAWWEMPEDARRGPHGLPIKWVCTGRDEAAAFDTWGPRRVVTVEMENGGAVTIRRALELDAAQGVTRSYFYTGGGHYWAGLVKWSW